MQHRHVRTHARVEFRPIVRQMLKRGMRSLERVNTEKHLKRNDCKRKPVGLAAKTLRVSISDTLHQHSRRKRWCLITIDVDEEELAEVGRNQKVHCIKTENQNAAAVNVRPACLQLANKAQRQLRSDAVSLPKGFRKELTKRISLAGGAHRITNGPVAGIEHQLEGTDDIWLDQHGELVDLFLR